MPLILTSVALGALITFAAAYAILRRRQAPATSEWIRPQKVMVDDPVLGQCEVSLPVVNQNHNQGSVECSVNIDGSPCQLREFFFDETGGTNGLDEAISILRGFHQLVTNAEDLKRFKNAMVEALYMHRTIMPHVPLTEVELKRSATLSRVQQGTDGTTDVIFHSPKFLEGRHIYVSVRTDGSVKSVAVG